MNLKPCANAGDCIFKRTPKEKVFNGVALAVCQAGQKTWQACDHMGKPDDKTPWGKIWKMNVNSFFPSLRKWRQQNGNKAGVK